MQSVPHFECPITTRRGKHVDLNILATVDANQFAIVGIAFGIVLSGAVAIRIGFRRGKTPLDI